MPTKVILKINKGQLAGEKFSFDQKESLILGRQHDCSIVFPDNSVSRYHCMLDIAPPSVIVRDFGSLNGTYINGEIIGRRDSAMSIEEGREQIFAEFPMKPGDRLELGKDCEITLDIAHSQYCAECFCEIDQTEYKDINNMNLCVDCYTKAQKQNKKREKELRTTAFDENEKQNAWQSNQKEADRKAEELCKASEKTKRNDRRCEVCDVILSGDTNESKVCPACRNKPVNVLKFMLQQANKGNKDVSGIAGYRNIRLLGRGGMGAVWLVEEEKTGKEMALKLMLPEVASKEKSRDFFLREANVAGQLDHKNVVRQFKYGQSFDTYFILMEFCQGGCVDALIKRNGGRLNLELATHIILQVLEGLHYTHYAQVVAIFKNGETQVATGVVHRDLKPENIFLSDNSARPIVKIADFGLAKTFETAGLSGHTRTGNVAGTALFMPRQQIINYRYAKPDVDVWAAAACYYHMLTGTYPKDFYGHDAYAASLKNPSVPINKRNVAIPRKLAEVIDTALNELPDIGIQSALELKTRIEKAL